MIPDQVTFPSLAAFLAVRPGTVTRVPEEAVNPIVQLAYGRTFALTVNGPPRVAGEVTDVIVINGVAVARGVRVTVAVGRGVAWSG